MREKEKKSSWIVIGQLQIQTRDLRVPSPSRGEPESCRVEPGLGLGLDQFLNFESRLVLGLESFFELESGLGLGLDQFSKIESKPERTLDSGTLNVFSIFNENDC